MLDKKFDSMHNELGSTNKKIKKMIRDTLKYLQVIINKRVNEETSLEKVKPKELALPDKRKLLKKIYAEVLTQMGEEENIPVFKKLIDNVPESYLDYELEIDLPEAGVFVKDLLKGTGQIAPNELGNIINIVAGVGGPAIVQHAAKGKYLAPIVGDFGAKEINTNVREYIKSKQERMNDKFKLPAPEVKELAKTEQSKNLAEIKRDLMLLLPAMVKAEDLHNTNLGRIASKIKSNGVSSLKDRLPDLSQILKKSVNHKEANKELKKSNIALEFKSQTEFEEFLGSLHAKGKEYVEAKAKQKGKKNNKTFEQEQ